MLPAAILKESSNELVSEREDGEKETIAVESLGSISDGHQPSIIINMRSTDGTLAPDTAELVAGLLYEAHQAEINQLAGE